MSSIFVPPENKIINDDFVVSIELWNDREIKGVDYQLNTLYQIRLQMLEDRILSSAKKQYGEGIEFSDFFSLGKGELGLLCGIIQLKLENRKSIIVNLEVDEDVLLPNEDYCFDEKIKKSKKDCLNLVTKDCIINLENIDIYKYCHGAVVGVYGSKVESSQSFSVKDIIYPEPVLQKERVEASEEKYICFISDLKFSKGDFTENECHLNFLSTYFQEGSSNLPEAFQTIFKNVERIVIAGGTFDDSEFYKRSYNILDLKEPLVSHKQLIKADRYYKSLTNFAPVHVIPSICDIGSGSWPVQPPYRRVFKMCRKLEKDFYLTTNPTFFETDGVVFLGTSGENVADILRTRENESCLDVMEQLLKYQHLSPTAPDHMSVFINKKIDHMVLRKTPHVFFCGGQNQFEKKIIKLQDYEILLLALPSFSTTNTVTFVNTKTLETFPFTLNLCIS